MSEVEEEHAPTIRMPTFHTYKITTWNQNWNPHYARTCGGAGVYKRARRKRVDSSSVSSVKESSREDLARGGGPHRRGITTLPSHGGD